MDSCPSRYQKTSLIADDPLKTQNKILILIKGPLDQAVPLISIARHFAAMGHQVTIGCGTCVASLREILQNDRIMVTELTMQPPPVVLPQFLRKILGWVAFRRGARPLVLEHSGVLYVGSADTAIALSGLLPAGGFILHLRELHDRQPLYMHALRPLARKARHVVVPEINRAYLYKYFLGLPRLPIVLPNKPFSHFRTRKLPIDFLPQEVREKMASRKCLIYQGQIHPERDLRPLLRALASRQEYGLIVMGRDYGELDSYRAILPDLIHIPFIPAPLHLHVTSWAHVGLITYDTKALNTIYCAPNKIWEYSGFGLPMLCHVNLGLQNTVGAAGAAEIVELEDTGAVLEALRRIETNYEVMQQKSLTFYDSVDSSQVLRSLLPASDALTA